MLYYTVRQVSATGNGSSTMVALVINPRVEGAGLHATKVGNIDWKNSRNDKYVFERIPYSDFIVIGNATCEQYVGDPFAIVE